MYVSSLSSCCLVNLTFRVICSHLSTWANIFVWRILASQMAGAAFAMETILHLFFTCSHTSYRWWTVRGWMNGAMIQTSFKIAGFLSVLRNPCTFTHSNCLWFIKYCGLFGYPGKSRLLTLTNDASLTSNYFCLSFDQLITVRAATLLRSWLTWLHQTREVLAFER